MESGPAGTRPAVRRRRRRAPGRCVDRRTVHRRHKSAIRDSRIEPTRRLAEAAARADDGPRTFVSASAIGYYGFDRGDALLCEESARGDGFLADVVADWEAATAPAAEAGLRVCQRAHGNRAVRARRHAAADAPAVRGRVGRPARQRRAVAVVDRARRPARRVLPRAVRHPADRARSTPSRPRRCATPTTPRRSRGVLHRPAVLPVPSLGPRLLLGQQGARELAEANQRVVPTKLEIAWATGSGGQRIDGRAGSRTRARLTGHVRQEAAHQGRGSVVADAVGEFCCAGA